MLRGFDLSLMSRLTLDSNVLNSFPYPKVRFSKIDWGCDYSLVDMMDWVSDYGFVVNEQVDAAQWIWEIIGWCLNMVVTRIFKGPIKPEIDTGHHKL